MRVLAILATHNERRFIAGCLDHLSGQGVDVYLIDNGSTDETVAIAERFLGRGLAGIEHFPRAGIFEWQSLLRRKEELSAELDADWFVHVDADEIRLPPRSGQTLREKIAEVDSEGWNAIDFMEFTFIPTRENQDNDHAHFRRTMRHYYPFAPFTPHRLTAWKRQPAQVELAWSAGHLVRFPGLRVYPEQFRMRHYLFLSVGHFLEKYGQRVFSGKELELGWHGWRADFDAFKIALPSQDEMRIWTSDDDLDSSNPRTSHFAQQWRKGAAAPGVMRP
jgi:glycosyltransferase involved in cell wall biosynthesis